MSAVAIITGLSGVGKTWLLQHVMKTLPGQLLSASSLIQEELNRSYSESVRHDDLRTLSIAANQVSLLAEFARTVDRDIGLIVLDAHVVIDTPRGLEFIPYDVFSGLTPSLLIFVEGDPKEIFGHRSQDRVRKRPFRNIAELALQQSQALEAARQIATDLRVPFHIVSAGDIEGLSALLMIQIGADHE